MTDEHFVSYAQNGEDVVLHRALGHLRNGRYVEVGGNDPTALSVSAAFYQRGWSGIVVEPMTFYTDRYREQRPRDIVVEAAIADDPSGFVVLHQIDGTGLSTLVDAVGRRHEEAGWAVTEQRVPARRLDEVLESSGWDGLDIHFLLVDTEGSERSVLETIDLHRWRPWVMLIEATEPLSSAPTHDQWESLILDAGYSFCLFDGLSRFYVADERREELAAALSYPACPHDNFVTDQVVSLQRQEQSLRDRIAQLDRDVLAERGRADAERERGDAELAAINESLRQSLAGMVRWRERALRTWADSIVPGSEEDARELEFLRGHAHALFTQLQDTQAKLDEVQGTVSWRVTAPLREVRQLRSRLHV